MLLPENVHPSDSLYFNGAVVLEALKRVGTADLLDLFLEARKNRADLSLPIFVLTLDWLFLANLVDRDDRGKVLPCF